MKASDLRNAVLQLAIQGKLVPQSSNDEPASVLLERLQAEKEQLIKTKQIKKEKPVPEISEEEKPFEIPESWVWVRLNEVLDVRDGTHDTPKYVKCGIPLVTSKNLVKGKLSFEVIKYISLEDHTKISQRSAVDDGDILFAMIGSIGNPVIVQKTIDFSIKNVALLKNLPNKQIDVKYLLYYLQHEQVKMKKIATGGVQSFVSLSFLREYPFPLPPLAEQLRIVAKIEEIMPKIDEYEKYEQELSSLEDTFPDNLKKSILQYAVQGKLVQQDPEDEPVNVLLDRIKAEKDQLIKEGKIKKEKRLPEISDDEKPCEIPVSWEWVRLGEITNILRGASPRPKGSPLYWAKQRTQFHWITISDITHFTEKTVLKDTKEFLTEAGSKLSTHVNKDELIIAVSGSTTGKSCVTGIEGYIYDGLAVIQNNNHILDVNFLAMFMKYLYEKLNSSKIGSAFPNINTEVLKNIVFPLPPLAEQHRIVDKVEKLMLLCDELKIV